MKQKKKKKKIFDLYIFVILQGYLLEAEITSILL